MIQARGLQGGYGSKSVLQGIDLDLLEGEFAALVGPNGAGKSTLLRALAGLLPYQGELLLQGRKLSEIPVRERARLIAFVPQSVSYSFAFSCQELVMMGRYPYLDRLGWSEAGHREVVLRCLRQTSTSHLAERSVLELSGGELQRVRIAQALAQESRLLLLDEPTAHLDLCHQVELMELLRDLHTGGLTILVTIHDLNLAAPYCQRLFLLDQGRLRLTGEPLAFCEDALVDAVFQVELDRWRREDRPARLFADRSLRPGSTG
jgi:iron complex transport system ATP-binding protein